MSARLERTISLAFVALVLAFLFLPAIVVVVFAFEPTERLSLPLTGFSLKWFGVVLGTREFQTAVTNSVIAAATSAVAATLLGTGAAFGLSHLRPSWRQTGSTLFLLPAVVPGLLLGVSLIILYRLMGLQTGIGTIVIGHIVICAPFVVLTVSAQLDQFDRSLLEAARDLGASGWRATWDVTMPLVRTAIVGAAFLAAALSLDEFIVTFFINGGVTTGPLLIWGLMRLGIDPSINALATLVLVATVVLCVISSRVTKVQL